jgi:hypothetical protein
MLKFGIAKKTPAFVSPFARPAKILSNEYASRLASPCKFRRTVFLRRFRKYSELLKAVEADFFDEKSTRSSGSGLHDF